MGPHLIEQEVDALAISKTRKRELVALYQDLLGESQALVIASFHGLSVAETEQLRHAVRESGGRLMVVKNTLVKIALRESGYPLPDDASVFEGTTMMAFALQDPAATAKAVVDFAKEHDKALRVKAGYLGTQPVSAEQVKQLASLPPLPVMRAQVLGTIMAPASQLARLLAEPARQLAAVVHAYSEQDGAQAEATAA